MKGRNEYRPRVMKARLIPLVVALALFSGAANANDTSTPWAGESPAKSRLIVESYQFSGAGNLRAGIQIKLAPGWWTYWRMPGTSGMPPRFDWSGSKNLADDPELVWPAPRRAVAYSESLNVYRDEVVFPIDLRPADPSKPIELHLKLAFAICKDICVPVVAEHHLTLTPSSAEPDVDSENVALISAYTGRAPTPDPETCGLSIRQVRAERDGKNVALDIKVTGLSERRRPVVLIEGSDFVRATDAQAKPTGDIGAWTVRVGLGPATQLNTLAGRRLRITVIDEGRALEQIWVVGASGSSTSGLGLTPVSHRLLDPPEPGAGELFSLQ
jgi:DsbC/DsbD-like thiol-disulfide interchange protein